MDKRVRGSLNQEDPPFLPEQSLDLATALTAYTAGSAYVNHRDDSGAPRPGNVAGVVVLEPGPVRRPGLRHRRDVGGGDLRGRPPGVPGGLTGQGCGLHGWATSQLESSAHEVAVSQSLVPPLLAR